MQLKELEKLSWNGVDAMKKKRREEEEEEEQVPESEYLRRDGEMGNAGEEARSGCATALLT